MSKPSGAYDLGAAATWGGTRPGATDDVIFPNYLQNKVYAFTASSDLSFGAFKFGLYNQDDYFNNHVTFDLGASRKMTLNNGEDVVRFAGERLQAGKSSWTLKSGTIEGLTASGKPKYLMCNILQKNVQMVVDGTGSRLVLDAIKFTGEESLFCVTNGGYVQGAILGAQYNDKIKKNGSCTFCM